MRFMALWVLLYAIGVGIMLVVIAFGIGWSLDMHPPIGIAYDIGSNAAWVGLLTPVAGFLVCLAGMILLLIRRTVAAGRVVSLIGLGLYYVAALAVILEVGIYAFTRPGSPWGLVGYIVLIAVVVGLPAFFITRTLLRAQKAEKGES
jgi:hypothetical protein